MPTSHLLCPHCHHWINLQVVDGVPPPGLPLARKQALGARQCQVLDLLAEGLTVRQIAERLNIHPRTVGVHIRRLKERFHAENTAQLLHLCPPEGKKE